MDNLMAKKLICALSITLSIFFFCYYYDTAGYIQHFRATSNKKKLIEKTNAADSPTTLLFCHGIGGSSNCAQKFKTYLEIPFPIEALDFPGSANNFQTILRPHVRQARMHGSCCFAQEKEINVVLQHYSHLVSRGKKVILCGFSNGAANVITTSGTYDLANAAALIILSPYDNPIPLFKRLFGPLTAAAITYLQCSSGYNPRGISPDKVVSSIQQSIPIFIACSLQDTIVPAQGSIRLAHMLAKAGHPMVHLIVLHHGNHNSMFTGPDGAMLKNAFHAFLKKYGFTCNQQYAQEFDIDATLIR